MTAEQSIRNIERTMDAVNAATRNTPSTDPRADLVDLFEARAETHDDKSWIPVEEAVDLVMDREAEAIPAGEVAGTVWHKDQFWVTIETDAQGQVTISDELLVKLMTESGWVLLP